MLTRFWFVLNAEDRYGADNIGVTASCETEARKLAIEQLPLIYPYLSDKIDIIKSGVEVIADIDIRLLDRGHIIPNMGPVVFKGVWFPRLNLSTLTSCSHKH